jgi:hypothetical protein
MIKSLAGTLYVLFGIVLGALALSLFMIGTPNMQIGSAGPAFISIVAIFTGYGKIKDPHVVGPNEQEKREIAMIFAWVGCGQAYLGQKLRSLFFVSFLAISAFILVWGIVLMGGENPGSGAVMFYGIILVMFFLFWSIFDVNELCNRKGLVYTGGMLEMKYNNTKRGIQMLFITTFLLLLVLSVPLLIYNVVEKPIVSAFVVPSLLLPVYAAYITFKK